MVGNPFFLPSETDRDLLSIKTAFGHSVQMHRSTSTGESAAFVQLISRLARTAVKERASLFARHISLFGSKYGPQ